MKKLVSCLCAFVLLAPISACSKNDEEMKKDPVQDVIVDPDKDKVEKPEVDEELKDTPKVDNPELPVEKPVEQPVKPEVKPEPDVSTIDLSSLAAQIKETDIFKNSHDYDASNVADIYSGISDVELAEFIVMKNPMSPGGDEVAIFKANEGQVEAVLTAVGNRDAYGKGEGAFYPLEQEMFENSVIIQSGNYIIYIAARNVDEVVNLVNAIIK